jgi:hypothetical protein
VHLEIKLGKEQLPEVKQPNVYVAAAANVIFLIFLDA